MITRLHSGSSTGHRRASKHCFSTISTVLSHLILPSGESVRKSFALEGREQVAVANLFTFMRSNKALSKALGRLAATIFITSFWSSVSRADQSSGTPNFVQGKFAAPAQSLVNLQASYDEPQSSGNLNVVIVGWNDSSSSVTSVTDTTGNVYQLALGPTRVTGLLSQCIYYAKNIRAAPAGNRVTATFSRAAPYQDVRILEYSGVDRVNPLDATAGSSGTGTSSNSGSLTTTNAVDLLVAGNTVWTSTSEAGPEFTSRMITGIGDIAQDRVVTAPGSYTATAPLKSSGEWVMQMAAFRSAGALTADPTPTPSRAPTQPSTPTNALIAAYDFNEASGSTIHDASGNGNSGTVANADWITGISGTALLFNGADSIVTVSDSPSLDTARKLTLEAWVLPTTNDASRSRRIIYRPNTAAGTVNYVLRGISRRVGAPSFGLPLIGINLFAPSALPIGAWSHLAATYDGTRARIYVNGLLAASQPQTGTLSPSSQPLLIGTNWQGIIDEVRVYNRALTLTEIQNDMSTPVVGGSSPPVSPPAIDPGGGSSPPVSPPAIDPGGGSSPPVSPPAIDPGGGSSPPVSPPAIDPGVPGGANTYSTTFSTNENPISSGGRWLNGRVVGLDWTDMKVTSGLATGTVDQGNGYNDAIAILTGSWGSNQTVTATVKTQNPTGSAVEELELRLASSISAHSSTGYECLWGLQPSPNQYMAIVRWNGALGNITVLAQLNGTGSLTGSGTNKVAHQSTAPLLSIGDVIKATRVGNTITQYVNNVPILSVDDSTYKSGSPGMGYLRAYGGSETDFGFTSFSATDGTGL
jgi:hypothetical protein